MLPIAASGGLQVAPLQRQLGNKEHFMRILCLVVLLLPTCLFAQGRPAEAPVAKEQNSEGAAKETAPAPVSPRRVRAEAAGKAMGGQAPAPKPPTDRADMERRLNELQVRVDRLQQQLANRMQSGADMSLRRDELQQQSRKEPSSRVPMPQPDGQGNRAPRDFSGGSQMRGGNRQMLRQRILQGMQQRAAGRRNQGGPMQGDRNQGDRNKGGRNQGGPMQGDRNQGGPMQGDRNQGRRGKNQKNDQKNDSKKGKQKGK
jgi:hypothetical protein